MSRAIELSASTARLLSVGMSFAAGVLVGAILVTAMPGLVGEPAESGLDPTNPPLSTSSSGPSCFDGTVPSSAGWVHEAAVGDSYAVTLNATVLHDAGTAVHATVIPRSANEYELALHTAPSTSERSFDCERVQTAVVMSVSLPPSYPQVVVTLNDRAVLHVARDDTFPDLYSLPNPLNLTRQPISAREPISYRIM